MGLSTRNCWEPAHGKRARTRRQILIASEQVFASSSVERANVDQIADLARVSVGSIYSHFGSKTNLAIAYLDAVYDVLDDDISSAVAGEASPIRRVLVAGDVYIQHVIEFPVAARLAMVRAATPFSECRDELSRLLDRRIAKALVDVAADLKKAMSASEIPTIPLDEAMIFAWGAWHGVATMITRRDQLTIDPEIGVRALARGRHLLLTGLRIDHNFSDLPRTVG